MQNLNPRITIAFLVFLTVLKDIQAKLANKIVNGSPAEIEDYPYLVNLQGEFSCGGTIISDTYVLTAAHCIDKEDVNVLRIYYGSKDIDGGSYVNAERLIIHENYDTQYNLHNDIALIRIKGRFKFSSSVQPAQIAHSNFPVDTGDLCNIAGWGVTHDGRMSLHLLEAQVPIYDHDKCGQMYKDIADTMLCAGYPNGGTDTCQGDSGGPLILQDTVIGVVSFGKGCATKYPGVYTDVRHFNDWINENMN